VVTEQHLPAENDRCSESPREISVDAMVGRRPARSIVVTVSVVSVTVQVS